MAKITNIEKGAFLSLFNSGGNVLDFSTNSFDVFTQIASDLLCATTMDYLKGNL